MSKWQEFTMSIVNNKHKEMGIETIEESSAMVKLDDIIFYYKNDMEGYEATILYFKGGESLEVKETYANVKKIISA